MCGFCGIAYTSASSQTIDRGVLTRMNQTLHHRGPDASNDHVEPKIGMGHCRLSIIDLAGGAQPMSSPNGRYTLVFNGEIYNFPQLREALEKNGRQFKTHCDTEVILHLYELYGVDCLSKLRGMFAFAIWDRDQKTLFMARDRLGKKPLVYALTPDGILFASELKALLEYPALPREIDREAIHLYLTYQYIPSPHTIFKSIRKLPPAHYAIWKDGEFSVRRYWDVSFQKKTSLSLPEATDQLMEKLRESVRLRMISDVPVGAFLSGGIDSSLVVGLMSEISSQPVKTYSIGFEEADFSELEHARVVADRFGCDHHEFVVRPQATEILPRLAWHYGEPFADSSALPSYYVAKETRQHVTVALSGDGGDENFAGYYRYAAMGILDVWDKVPRLLRRAVAAAAAPVRVQDRPREMLWKLHRLLMLGDESAKDRYLQLVNTFTESQKQELYSPQMKGELQCSDARQYLFTILDGVQAEGIDRYLAADLHSYLPECLMTKMDIATMAVSLEARSPMLDHEFVEMAAQLPAHWKWKPILRTKWILRHGLKNWLPSSILARRKQGFSIPVDRWFRKDLKPYLENTVLSPKAIARGYFKPEAIRRMIDEHHSGAKNHSDRLWALLMLELWHQVYIDKTHTFP
jgi:asparagine synthase (glutamine-hydrolysing)